MVFFYVFDKCFTTWPGKIKGVRGTKRNKKWAQVITLGMRGKYIYIKSPNLENRFQQVAKFRE